VREWMQWFTRTHEVESIGMGGAVWRLRRLPRAGGVDQQDAKLMAALDVCRHVANELLAMRLAPSEQDELKAFHEQQVRERG